MERDCVYGRLKLKEIPVATFDLLPPWMTHLAKDVMI